MSGYAFNSQDVATFLRDFANSNLVGHGGSEAPLGREVILVKTPVGGLPSINNEKTTIIECERAHLDNPYMDGADRHADISATTYEKAKVPVLNLHTSDVAGSTFIQCTRAGAYWIAVTGGGSGIKTMKSTSEITARSGDTAGTGTAVSYESYNGVTYTLGTEDPPYDIINPYAQTVSNGIVIQCRQAAEGKWELIQAECEDTTTVDSGDSGGGDSGGGDSGGGPPSPGGL